MHFIDWALHSQYRVSYSAHGAEIFAATSTDNRGLLQGGSEDAVLAEPH